MSLANSRVDPSREPKITYLEEGRLRVERWFKIKHAADAYNNTLLQDVFGGFGLLDGQTDSSFTKTVRAHVAFSDCRVVRQEIDVRFDAEGQHHHELYLRYETLTDTWAKEVADKVEYSRSGLKLLTRTEVAEPGTALPALTVGTTTISAGVTLYLAGYSDASTDMQSRLITRWAEAGLDRVQKSPGPMAIPGSTRVTHTALGVADVPSGVLIEEDTGDYQGFKTYIRTALQGTLTGVKQTYKDVVDVEAPGTVELVTLAIPVSPSSLLPGDPVTGDQAVIDHQPPRPKRIAATVTVEVTTTPPNTATTAYDLGDISCSVIARQLEWNNRGSDIFISADGSNRSGAHKRQSASYGARIISYPRCYLVNNGVADPSVVGSFAYTTAYEHTNPESTSSIVTQGLTSYTKTLLDGRGSVDQVGGAPPASYVTTGVIRRRSRPILTDLAGTTYYEVITWST